MSSVRSRTLSVPNDVAEILPAQWLRPSVPATPERLLLAAILEQAALDACHEHPRLRAETWLWIRAPEERCRDPHDQPRGFSFPFVCAALGLSPDWVLQRMRQIAASVLQDDSPDPPDEPLPKRPTPRHRITGRRHIVTGLGRLG